MLTKGIIYRSFVISVIFAAITSTVSIVISTLQADTMILKGAQFEELARDADDKAMARYIEKLKKQRTGIERVVDAFTYPGFWVFWLRAFLYIAIPVFLGGLSLMLWNKKRPLV